jgi:uncharacterized lipoprotein YehR (DUF1307 family)
MKAQIISAEEKWVVAATPHIRSNKNMIVYRTIAHTRREAIQKFMRQSEYKRKDWERWRRECNYKAVKTTITIEINP